MAAERFGGEGAALLLTGAALHTDLTLDAPGGGAPAWLLAGIGQEHGFPVPEGGVGRADRGARPPARGRRRRGALRRTRHVDRRARSAGGRRPPGANGDEIAAPRGVLADVGAPALYRDLVGEENLPAQLRRRPRALRVRPRDVQGRLGASTAPCPGARRSCSRAGTVHLIDSIDHATEYTAQLMTGRVPARPFTLVGQMNVADPTRSPAGTSRRSGPTRTCPQHVRGDAGGTLTGRWDESEADEFADRLEAVIESYAPGFRATVAARHITTPGDLEAADANLVGGAVGGGTSALYQQLVFRPTPGLGRAETPIRSLFLASASAHPGPGVHGACGANAARAALAADRIRSLTGRRPSTKSAATELTSGTVGDMRHCARPGCNAAAVATLHVRRPAPHRLAQPARRGRGLLGRRPVPAPRRAHDAAAQLGAARHASRAPAPRRPAGTSAPSRYHGARRRPRRRRSPSSARPPAAPPPPILARAAHPSVLHPEATTPLLSRAFRNAG